MPPPYRAVTHELDPSSRGIGAAVDFTGEAITGLLDTGEAVRDAVAKIVADGVYVAVGGLLIAYKTLQDQLPTNNHS